MRRAAQVLAARGHAVWSANHRGCGPGRGLAARPYHSGSSADLAAVLVASHVEAPGLVHLAIGFSLSGNALLLMAAERRAQAFLWWTPSNIAFHCFPFGEVSIQRPGAAARRPREACAWNDRALMSGRVYPHDRTDPRA